MRVRVLGDRNCRQKKKSEGGEADEKECEAAFNVVHEEQVPRHERIETIGVFPHEDSIGDRLSSRAHHGSSNSGISTSAAKLKWTSIHN